MYKYIYLIIMIITYTNIKDILDNLNTQLSNLVYPDKFKTECKEILYSPQLNTYIFSNSSYCLNSNYENINLDRYWVDILSYQINKLGINELVKHLKHNDLSSDFKNQTNPNILITKNEYPYVVPQTDSQSYIIWNLLNTNLNFNDILQYFNLDNKNWVIWKNDPMYKSVKSIEHFHLFTRNSIPILKLKKILILQRHGPREPLIIPDKFISSYWNKTHENIEHAIKNANLTPLGKLYCKYMGNVLGWNYQKYFNFDLLNANNVLFASSNFQRTIETSVLVLDGLGLGNLNIDLKILDFLSSDSIFSQEQKEIYNKKLKDFNIDFEHDLENFNNQIFELTGFKIETFRDYFELASIIKCYEFHDYPMLSDSNANNELESIKNTIYNLATYYYNLVHDPTNPDLEEPILVGKTATTNILDLFSNSSYNFTLLTSHDNLLMPTIKYLVNGILNKTIQFESFSLSKDYYTQEIINKINFLKFPDFNSSIRLELWEDIYQKQKIRIYYLSLLLFEFDTI